MGMPQKPELDLSRLSELQRILQRATNLEEAWTFFLDHFGDHSDLAQAGAWVQDEKLEKIFLAVLTQLGRPNAGQLMFHRFASQRFTSGAAFPPAPRNETAVLLYFEEIDMGLIALLPPQGAVGGQPLYARISLTDLAPSMPAYAMATPRRPKA